MAKRKENGKGKSCGGIEAKKNQGEDGFGIADCGIEGGGADGNPKVLLSGQTHL